MNERFPNGELHDDAILSAYLDGEATPQERELVECALRQSPATRRLLEELGRTRACLHDLPRCQLGPDFARQVLRQAERAMLLGDSPRSVGEVRVAAARRFTASSVSWLRVAAAVMVLVPALVLMVIAARDPRPEARAVALGEAGAATSLDTDNRPLSERATSAHFDAPREEEQLPLADQFRGRSPDLAQHRRDSAKGIEAGDKLEKNGVEFVPAPTTAATAAPGAGGIGGGGGMGGGGPGGGGTAFRGFPAAGAPGGGALPAQPPGTMVVHVAVTAETWRAGLGKLLGREKDLKLRELPRTATFYENAEAGQPSDETKALSSVKLDALAESSSQVGVWNVEAGPGELEAVLFKLRQQAQARQNVLALAVQPPVQAKDAAPWASYNYAAEFWDQKQLPQLGRQAGQTGNEAAGEMFFGGGVEKAMAKGMQKGVEKAELRRDSEKFKKDSMDKRGLAVPAAPGGVGGFSKKPSNDPVKLEDGRREKLQLELRDGKPKLREDGSSATSPPASKSQRENKRSASMPEKEEAAAKMASGASRPLKQKDRAAAATTPSDAPAKPLPTPPPGTALRSAPAPQLTAEQAPRARALFIFYVPASAASPPAGAPNSPAAAKEKQR